MRMRSLLQSCSLGLVASCSLIPSASITPRIGPRSVEGDILVTSGSTSTGSDAETLGLDREDALFQPRADVSFGPFDFMASFHDAHYEGEGTAESQLDLGGVIINAGDTVESELNVRYTSALFAWDLFPTDLVDIGIGLGASSIDFDARVTATSSGNTVESAEEIIVPLLVLRAEVELGDLKTNLYVSGLSGSYNDVDATLLDIDLFAQYIFWDLPLSYGAINAGYRYLAIDVQYEEDGSDVDADLEFSGPYVGLSFGF